MKLTSTHIIIGAAIVGIGLLVAGKYLEGKANAIPEGTYDTLASCIADSGAKFYGAFWCPHCQDQKEMFGSAADLLPYVECSTPDSRNQTKECADAGITGYPTWILGNGEQLSGLIEMDILAEKTGCTL
jgi:hypothetical protein